MKERVLVTGASGFMGSHITEALVKLGKYDVYAIDDNSGGDKGNVPKGCYFLEHDLRVRRPTATIIEDMAPHYIYALAANAREGASFFQPVSVTERNINVYMNVLESAIRTKTLKKVIYFSSMAVYGHQTPPFDESYERRPCDVYGSSKAWCEHVTEMLSQAHGFKYTIIRPHNVFGERQCMKDIYRNVIAIFMNRIMRGEPIYIYGDGLQKRAFSYIDFSLPCYLRCLDEDVSGIFNIGGLKEVTVNDVARMIMDSFGEDKEIIHLPERHGEVKNAWSTFDKSVEILGYKETVDLRAAINRMSEWAKKTGPQEWTEEQLPLVNDKVPKTWTMPRKQEVGA